MNPQVPIEFVAFLFGPFLERESVLSILRIEYLVFLSTQNNQQVFKIKSKLFIS